MAAALRPSESPVKHRITVDEYYRMGEAGILRPEQRVELLGGDIYDRNPIGSLHASIVDEIALQFARAALDRLIIPRVQSPLRLDDDIEPVPDFMALAPRPGRYRASHPRARDVLLLVEVADTSLEYDMAKLPRYARSGVGEVWIVDLASRSVLVYRDPAGGQYGDPARRTEGLLAAARLPGVPVNLDALFA